MFQMELFKDAQKMAELTLICFLNIDNILLNAYYAPWSFTYISRSSSSFQKFKTDRLCL